MLCATVLLSLKGIEWNPTLYVHSVNTIITLFRPLRLHSYYWTICAGVVPVNNNNAFVDGRPVATNFATKGLRSKRWVSHYILQVAASLPTKALLRSHSQE